jgi:hypothetical protein
VIAAGGPTAGPAYTIDASEGRPPMPEKLRRGRPITVGELRSMLGAVPADAPLLVGIRDRHHFNTLLGDLAVVGVAVMPSPAGYAVVFDVESVS